MRYMKRVAFWAALLALLIGHPLHAQNTDSVSEIKAKIWEAELAQRNFARGLPHCNELNGTNFCFDARDYRRSLDNLVAQGSFNIALGIKRIPTRAWRRCRNKPSLIKSVARRLRAFL